MKTRGIPGLLASVLLAACASAPAPGPAGPGGGGITGDWNGTLTIGAVNLRVVFHITQSGSVLSGTMDSPDQNAKGIPLSAVKLSGSDVRLEIASISGVYTGTLSADARTIHGTWTQGASSLPLELSRGSAPVMLRPQTPVPPFPYDVKNVKIAGPGGAVIGATLTIPSGGGPYPAVILVSGSGQQNRDEEIFGHKPFLVLADKLTRAGIAVLRYDDRGVGESTGDPRTATTADFAQDASMVFDYLLKISGVDAAKAGIIGHSEGGLIAEMLAAQRRDVAFIVMLAGPGLPGDQLLSLQAAALVRASGGTQADVDAANAINHALYGVVKSAQDAATASAAVRKILADAHIPEDQIAAQTAQLMLPWTRFFVSYDPGNDLRKIRCPVLALDGNKDLQVTAKENLAAIRQGLSEGGNSAVTTVELPGLNHLFQQASTGLPAEYPQIEQTMAPIVWDTIIPWIKAL